MKFHFSDKIKYFNLRFHPLKKRFYASVSMRVSFGMISVVVRFMGVQKRSFCEAVNCEEVKQEGKFLFALSGGTNAFCHVP